MSFRIAEKQALKSTFQQHRLGAVIVKGGRVLATGYNSRRPSSVLGTNTLHAEASAILKLMKDRRLSDLVGADIYVTRFTKGGRIGNATPCVDCFNLICSVGIKRIYCTQDDGTTKVIKV